MKAKVLVLLALAGGILVGCASDDNPNDPNDKGKGVGEHGRSIKDAAGAGQPGAVTGAKPSSQ